VAFFSGEKLVTHTFEVRNGFSSPEKQKRKEAFFFSKKVLESLHSMKIFEEM